MLQIILPPPRVKTGQNSILEGRNHPEPNKSIYRNGDGKPDKQLLPTRKRIYTGGGGVPFGQKDVTEIFC